MDHLFKKVLLIIIIMVATVSTSSTPQKVHAAANIIVASPTISSDGKTITATLSGGTGAGYTITNTTGVTVKNMNYAGAVYKITSATVTAGNQLTLTVGFPFGSGEVMNLDVAITNTITDSGGGNNAQLVSGLSAVSPSTLSVTRINSTNANIRQTGSATTTTFQSRSIFNSYSFGMRFDTSFTGTDIAFVANNAAGTSVGTNVDGVSGTVTLPTGNAATNYWGVFPIVSGLSQGTHAVTMFPSGVYLDTGTSPISSGFILIAGAPSSISAPVGFGTQYWLSDAPFTTYGAIDGSPSSIGGAGGNHLAYGLQGGQGIRFASNTSMITIWGTPIPITYVLYQDGVRIAAGTTPTSQYVYTRFNLASGLDTSTTHEYEIVISKPTIATSNYVAMIELDGNGIAPIKHVPRPIEVFYGDSITAQVGITDATLGDAFIMARAIGSTTSVRGASNMNASTYGRDHTGDILANASRVWERFGHNDNYHNVPIGAIGSAGTFKGDFYTMLVNIRARIGAGKPIMVEQMFPTTIANRTLYNTAMVDVVTAYKANTADKFVKLINTDNWINPTTGVDTLDGTHPNASGYAKIANREIPFAYGDGYTVMGPYHGTSAVASESFKVTIAKGATFTGDVSITISDNGGMGSFTPSIGTANVGTITVMPPSGATSFTFTYTPSSIGKKFLKFTNSAGWGNPLEMMYVSEKQAAPDHRPPGGVVLL